MQKKPAQFPRVRAEPESTNYISQDEYDPTENQTHYITQDYDIPSANNTRDKSCNTRILIQEVMLACMNTTKTGNTKETSIKKNSIRNIMQMGRIRNWCRNGGIT